MGRLQIFAGIDLAWGDRRDSGVAVLTLHDGCLQEAMPTCTVQTDAQLCEYLSTFREAEVLVIAVGARCSPSRMRFGGCSPQQQGSPQWLLR